MKKQIKTTFLLGTIFSAGLIGCKKDKDLVNVPPPTFNEQEVITTVKITFTDSANTANVITATFRDPDGDGGDDFDIFDTIRLAPNKTYYANIELLDETKDPAEDITEEIEEEADEHLFCFTPTTSVNLTVEITDTDIDGLPIGLKSTWRTGNAGNGNILVILKHQTEGSKNGTCDVGDTDIEVDFRVEIQ
jgi:hypothetical protein